MNIQQKILQFRKERQLAGRCVDNLVYRVSKDEAIEVAKLISTSYWLMSSQDATCALLQADIGSFSDLRKIMLELDGLYGVKIYPDWQEHTNKNMYY